MRYCVIDGGKCYEIDEHQLRQAMKGEYFSDRAFVCPPVNSFILRDLERKAAQYRAKLAAELRQVGDTDAQASARADRELMRQARERAAEGQADIHEYMEYLRERASARKAHAPEPPNPRYQAREYRQWRQENESRAISRALSRGIFDGR